MVSHYLVFCLFVGTLREFCNQFVKVRYRKVVLVDHPGGDLLKVRAQHPLPDNPLSSRWRIFIWRERKRPPIESIIKAAAIAMVRSCQKRRIRTRVETP
jgi:hypothetical protein